MLNEARLASKETLEDPNLTEIVKRVRLQTDSVVPLYVQIADVIERCILAGIIKPGSQLPSYDRLGEALGVDSLTIRRCYKQVLTERRLIGVRTGLGTFVNAVEDAKVVLNGTIERSLRLVAGNALDVGVDKSELSAIFNRALEAL